MDLALHSQELLPCEMWDWQVLLAWGQALLEAFPAAGAVLRAGASTRVSRGAAGPASCCLIFPAVQRADASAPAAYQGYGRRKELGRRGDAALLGSSAPRGGALSSVCVHFPSLALLWYWRQAGRRGEICSSSVQSGLFVWSRDPHTRVRGRAGSRCGLQAGALTLPHSAYCSCHPMVRVPSPSCPALHSVGIESMKPGLQI